MTKKKFIHLLHGDAIKIEFPERRHWFIPELVKQINKVLGAVKNSSCKVNLKNYLDDIFEIEIWYGTISRTEVMNYKDYTFQFDKFVIDVFIKLNNVLAKLLNGNVIVPFRFGNKSDNAYTISNLFFGFANRSELTNGIPEYYPLGSGDTYLSLISDVATEEPQIPDRVSFDQLKLKSKSELYEGTHYLPIHPGKDFSKFLQMEFNKILNLDANNKIKIAIGALLDEKLEKVEITLSNGEIQQTKQIDSRDFYVLGLIFNDLLSEETHRYCLVQPDDDNYIYTYCTGEEFENLRRHDFVAKNYLNIFEGDR